MTDNTTTTTDRTAETETDDQSDSSFSPEYRETMGEMDHSPPVEGAHRTFQRKHEARPAKTDGGPRGVAGTSEETTPDATRSDGDRETMGEMDHSSPVDGPNRVFERGSEGSDVRK